MPRDRDVVAAYADHSTLADFDGREVVRSTIKITNAGDGLSDAMAVDPTEYHHGQEVTIVMRGIVSRVGFDPLDPDDVDGSALARVHTVKAGTAVILDEAGEKKVLPSLNRQADRIKRAMEAAKGVERLPGVDDPPADDGDEGAGGEVVDLDTARGGE